MPVPGSVPNWKTLSGLVIIPFKQNLSVWKNCFPRTSTERKIEIAETAPLPVDIDVFITDIWASTCQVATSVNLSAPSPAPRNPRAAFPVQIKAPSGGDDFKQSLINGFFQTTGQSVPA